MDKATGGGRQTAAGVRADLPTKKKGALGSGGIPEAVSQGYSRNGVPHSLTRCHTA